MTDEEKAEEYVNNVIKGCEEYFTESEVFSMITCYKDGLAEGRKEGYEQGKNNEREAQCGKKNFEKDIAKLEKENAELKAQISILLSCKECPENKGGYICEKEYNDKCLAQKIEYIKELIEENARLSKMLEMAMADALSQSHYAECNGSVYGLNCENVDEYRQKLEKRVEETK